MNITIDKPENWEKYANELRKIEGCKNISDDLAEKVIDFLFQIANLEYEMKFGEKDQLKRCKIHNE